MQPAGTIFIHPSDEHYGADRVLLALVQLLPQERLASSEFWLPTDVPHGASPLCVQLESRGAVVRHVDLPILRRAYRTPRALLSLLRRARGLRKLLLEQQPSMVYCTTSATYLAAPVARRAGVPTVVGHVQEIWSRADTLVLGRAARAFGRLVAISGPVKAALPASLQERTTVVQNATPEPERLVPLSEHAGHLVYVVASRWNAWKGHRTLLAAWDRLDAPGELVILGGPPGSGEVVDVSALVQKLRRRETVRLVGEVADPHKYIEEADVMIVPSDRPEPFGLVAIEAFARGRPVIGTAAGGLVDIVTDGEDGWLFAPEDVGALSDLLASLTRRQVVSAGTAARRTYEERFTAARYAADWNAALTGLTTPA